DRRRCGGRRALDRVPSLRARRGRRRGGAERRRRRRVGSAAGRREAAMGDARELRAGAGVARVLARRARAALDARRPGLARERLLEPLVVSAERRFAAKQLGDGRVLASDLSGNSRARVREGIEELLPALVYVPLPLLVEGVYDVTPDHQAILGRVRDNVWVA